MADGRGSLEDLSNFEIYRQGGSTPDIILTLLLVLVGRRWRALVDDRLRSIGQSSARMEALSAIMNAPAPSSQVLIANRLRIEGPTITRMIDALSRDGLVERRAAPDDRRSKHLSLTEAGNEALAQIFEVVDPLRERLLDGFDETDLEHTRKMLRVMLARLDDGLPGDERN